MKIFVINLKRSTQRRDKMKEQLEKLGLNYEFLSAVDGKSLSAEDIKKNCDVAAIEKQKMSKGQIGCAISHYSAYQRIIAENVDKALILEDDLVIGKSFADALPVLEKELVDDEILMLTLLAEDETALTEGGSKEINRVHRLYHLQNSHFFHASAYMLTKKTAETMSRAVFPIQTPADYWNHFYEKRGFKAARCVHPFLTHQNFGKSEIGYVKDNMLNKILWLIDKNNIPIINNILKNKRKKIWLEGMSQVKFTGEPTVFSHAAKTSVE